MAQYRIVKVSEYLRVSLLKAGLDCMLKTSSSSANNNDGIYFYNKGGSPLQALSLEGFYRLLHDNKEKLDPGCLSVIEEFTEENKLAINLGAAYIPTHALYPAADYLGLED